MSQSSISCPPQGAALLVRNVQGLVSPMIKREDYLEAVKTIENLRQEDEQKQCPNPAELPNSTEATPRTVSRTTVEVDTRSDPSSSPSAWTGLHFLQGVLLTVNGGSCVSDGECKQYIHRTSHASHAQFFLARGASTSCFFCSVSQKSHRLALMSCFAFLHLPLCFSPSNGTNTDTPRTGFAEQFPSTHVADRDDYVSQDRQRLMFHLLCRPS